MRSGSQNGRAVGLPSNIGHGWPTLVTTDASMTTNWRMSVSNGLPRRNRMQPTQHKR